MSHEKEIAKLQLYLSEKRSENDDPDWGNSDDYYDAGLDNGAAMAAGKALVIIEAQQLEIEALKAREEKVYETARATGFTEHARLCHAESALLKEKLEIATNALQAYANDTGVLNIGGHARSALEQLKQK